MCRSESPQFVFFFQAEDGIRDYKVTGVQTCALPISAQLQIKGPLPIRLVANWTLAILLAGMVALFVGRFARNLYRLAKLERSEERRVGKEGRSRWAPYH